MGRLPAVAGGGPAAPEMVQTGKATGPRLLGLPGCRSSAALYHIGLPCTILGSGSPAGKKFCEPVVYADTGLSFLGQRDDLDILSSKGGGRNGREEEMSTLQGTRGP